MQLEWAHCRALVCLLIEAGLEPFGGLAGCVGLKCIPSAEQQCSASGEQRTNGLTALMGEQAIGQRFALQGSQSFTLAQMGLAFRAERVHDPSPSRKRQ
jgi:hypothetical protein